MEGKLPTDEKQNLKKTSYSLRKQIDLLNSKDIPTKMKEIEKILPPQFQKTEHEKYQTLSTIARLENNILEMENSIFSSNFTMKNIFPQSSSKFKNRKRVKKEEKKYKKLNYFDNELLIFESITKSIEWSSNNNLQKKIKPKNIYGTANTSAGSIPYINFESSHQRSGINWLKDKTEVNDQTHLEVTGSESQETGLDYLSACSSCTSVYYDTELDLNEKKWTGRSYEELEEEWFTTYNTFMDDKDGFYARVSVPSRDFSEKYKDQKFLDAVDIEDDDELPTQNESLNEIDEQNCNKEINCLDEDNLLKIDFPQTSNSHGTFWGSDKKLIHSKDVLTVQAKKVSNTLERKKRHNKTKSHIPFKPVSSFPMWLQKQKEEAKLHNRTYIEDLSKFTIVEVEYTP